MFAPWIQYTRSIIDTINQKKRGNLRKFVENSRLIHNIYKKKQQARNMNIFLVVQGAVVEMKLKLYFVYFVYVHRSKENQKSCREKKNYVWKKQVLITWSVWNTTETSLIPLTSPPLPLYHTPLNSNYLFCFHYANAL